MNLFGNRAQWALSATEAWWHERREHLDRAGRRCVQCDARSGIRLVKGRWFCKSVGVCIARQVEQSDRAIARETSSQESSQS